MRFPKAPAGGRCQSNSVAFETLDETFAGGAVTGVTVPFVALLGMAVTLIAMSSGTGITGLQLGVSSRVLRFIESMLVTCGVRRLRPLAKPARMLACCASADPVGHLRFHFRASPAAFGWSPWRLDLPPAGGFVATSSSAGSVKLCVGVTAAIV